MGAILFRLGLLALLALGAFLSASAEPQPTIRETSEVRLSACPSLADDDADDDSAESTSAELAWLSPREDIRPPELEGGFEAPRLHTTRRLRILRREEERGPPAV